MTITPDIFTMAADWFDPPDEGGGAEDRELALTCSRDLRVLIRQAWPLLEPSRPFVPSWHIDCVAEHLMAVSAGEIPRLIVNQPPGSSKSSVAAILWPAWEWMLRPHVRWIFASYAQTFAFRDSRKMRTLIQSRGGRPEGGLFERRGYQGVLMLLGQHWALQEDQNTKGRYDTTATGFRLATSVDGQVTGDHADRIICLAGDTLIDTNRGPLPIRDIVEQRLPVLVRGSSGGWQCITEYESGPGRPMLEIQVAGGARLRCTEDHPVYVEGAGFRPATTVMSSYGSIHLRGLRNDLRPGAGACGAQHAGPVLLAGMPQAGDDRRGSSALDAGRDADVRALRAGVRQQAVRVDAASVLLDGVRGAGAPRAAAPGVRDVRSVVHPGAGAQATVLQPGLRERRASDGGTGRGERALHPRRLGDGIQPGIHGQVAGGRAGARPQPLRDVHEGGADPAGAPHRRLEGQPRADEPRHGLPQLPPQGAYEDRDQRRHDAPVRVIAVRRCGTPDAVYNLRVEPDHDYYANGLLVHNCDDPLNPKQAHSEAERENANRWWDDTMVSRFIDSKAAAVIVQQRLHERDLTGHLLAKDEGWHHLCLPAEWSPKHPFTYPAKATLPSGRVIDGDPRTEPGELLDPIRLSDEQLKGPRARPSVFAGQFMQLPSPEGGGMFQREWFTGPAARRWQADDLPRLHHGFDRKVWSWDMAFKDTKGSDFVVGQLWGFHGADSYLLAQIRGRFDFTTTLHVVKAGVKFCPEATARLVEDKANGTAVINTLRSKVGGLIAITPKESKWARAGAVAPWSEAHNVLLPAADVIPCPAGYADEAGTFHALVPTTVDEWVHEHATFNAGAHDDMVDAHSQALNYARPVHIDREPVMPEQPRTGTIMGGVLQEKWAPSCI